MAYGERGSDASDWELVARFVRRYRQQALIIIVVSVLLNLLVFAGSLYMMLIYDSVLPSRSVPTLAGLVILNAIIYLFQAAFEFLRSEAFQNIAAGVQTDLFPAIHHAIASHSLQRGAPANDGLQLTRDMDSVHGFLSGAGPMAIIDLPWVLLFLGVLFGLHWWLGLAALAGALVLALIAWMNSRSSADGAQRSSEIVGRRIPPEIRFLPAGLRWHSSRWSRSGRLGRRDFISARDQPLFRGRSGAQ